MPDTPNEENYDFLEEKGITPFVKYNYFDKELKDKKHRENPFSPDNLFYNAETDTYYCPIGQPMGYAGERKRKTANGFIQTHRLYQAKNCDGCPMRGPCHKAEVEPHHPAKQQPHPPPAEDKTLARK